MAQSLSEKLDAIKLVLENPVWLSAFTSWFMAQLIKTATLMLKRRRRSVREIAENFIWKTGGMPSSHSALVASLTASVAFSEGANSNLFIVTLMLALITIRDAVGVRRSSGLQSRALNALGRQLSERFGVDYHPVKEVHGHAPLEVAVGIFIGGFIAAAYNFL
jgi:acid phosphatase family membrane protein YuiD